MHLLIRVTIWAALLAAAPLIQADSWSSAYSPRRAHGLDIGQATYGARGKTCDATVVVRERCQGETKCRVYSSNRLCGDPIHGTKKELVIGYFCDGKRHQISIREKKSKSLKCRSRRRGDSSLTFSAPSSFSRGGHQGGGARGAIQILYAKYGNKSRRSCDATFAARRACDGLSHCAVLAGNQLCGDPARGYRKRLRLGYRCLGVTRHVQVNQESTARLSCGVPTRQDSQSGSRRREGHFGSSRSAEPSYGRYGLHITDVTYRGPNGSYCDATMRVRRACDGQRRCSVRAGNRLCGDPQRGVKKKLSVGYHCGGRRRVVQAEEDSTATVGCR